MLKIVDGKIVIETMSDAVGIINDCNAFEAVGWSPQWYPELREATWALNTEQALLKGATVALNFLVKKAMKDRVGELPEIGTEMYIPASEYITGGLAVISDVRPSISAGEITATVCFQDIDLSYNLEFLRPQQAALAEEFKTARAENY